MTMQELTREGISRKLEAAGFDELAVNEILETYDELYQTDAPFDADERHDLMLDILETLLTP